MSAEKGVIFDFNGVMIDDYLLQKDSWSSIASELRGISVSDDEMIGKIRGIPTRVTVRRMAQEAGINLSEEEVHNFARRKEDIVSDLFRSSPLTRLTKGLTQFLDELKKNNVPVTIASSSSLDLLKVVFDRFNLYSWFNINTIIHRDSVLDGRKLGNKPLPDPYIAGAKILGLQTDECIVFEDAKSGIQAAIDAGVKSIIAINSNPEHLSLLTVIPGVIKGIKDFSEISADELFN